MRWIVRAATAVLALWLLACAWYYTMQDRMIFQRTTPAVPAASATAHDVRFEVDGATLAGWLVNPEGRVNVVYFGGNAESIALHAVRFAAIDDARTLLVDYRGYGRSTGNPSQRALVDDAIRYVPVLTDPDKPVLLVGRSLGTGVAALAAASLGDRVDTLLLVSPFCSFRNVVERLAPAWLPAGLLLKHPFDVATAAARLEQPIWIVLARADVVVTPAESRCLAAQLGLAPTAVRELPDRGHNEVFDALWPEVRAQVAALRI